jgi:energy-converting hydrogenase Eha subunit H
VGGPRGTRRCECGMVRLRVAALLAILMLALNNQLATTELFAAVLVLSLMGIALFFLVGVVERLVIPWHHETRRAVRQQ